MGSEFASWKWAGAARHCDTCGEKLRIKDVGLFYTDISGERKIRGYCCVNAKTQAFISKTRRDMGMAA
jgi:hypothetical protein